jgi:hypothetical protein
MFENRRKWTPFEYTLAAIISGLLVLVAIFVLWMFGILHFNSDRPFVSFGSEEVVTTKSETTTKVVAPAPSTSVPVAPAPFAKPPEAVASAVAIVPASGASASASATSAASGPATAKAEAKVEVKIVSPPDKPPKKRAVRPDLSRKAEPKALAASVAQAPAPTPVKVWEHWGAAPYATSQGEACAKAPVAIDGLNVPQAVKDALKRKLGATCEGGEQVWLTPYQRLDQMWSGPDSKHKQDYVMANVAVAELPVVRAPDGRLYRKGAVAETAKALSWTVVHEGRSYSLYLPFECFNWSIGIGPAPTPPAPVAAAPVLPPVLGSCPDVYTLRVNVWQRPALALRGVERTHAREELEQRFTYVPHVSREHGAQFRKAYAAGEVARSGTSRVFRVSLIMTPEAQGGAPSITAEEVIGDMSITGLRELKFTRAQLVKWDAIRVIATAGDVLSPPLYHVTGLHELRFFNHLPRTTLGEWDNNPVPDCIMNEHWIE